VNDSWLTSFIQQGGLNAFVLAFDYCNSKNNILFATCSLEIANGLEVVLNRKVTIEIVIEKSKSSDVCIFGG